MYNVVNMFCIFNFFFNLQQNNIALFNWDPYMSHIECKLGLSSNVDWILYNMKYIADRDCTKRC